MKTQELMNKEEYIQIYVEYTEKIKQIIEMGGYPRDTFEARDRIEQLFIIRFGLPIQLFLYNSYYNS
ncbi:MAG: hypothetical protein WCX48_11020 [Bacteroidales bacterium]|jgi:hypothetical protein